MDVNRKNRLHFGNEGCSTMNTVGWKCNYKKWMGNSSTPLIRYMYIDILPKPENGKMDNLL